MRIHWHTRLRSIGPTDYALHPLTPPLQVFTALDKAQRRFGCDAGASRTCTLHACTVGDIATLGRTSSCTAAGKHLWSCWFCPAPRFHHCDFRLENVMEHFPSRDHNADDAISIAVSGHPETRQVESRVDDPGAAVFISWPCGQAPGAGHPTVLARLPTSFRQLNCLASWSQAVCAAVQDDRLWARKGEHNAAGAGFGGPRQHAAW